YRPSSPRGTTTQDPDGETGTGRPCWQCRNCRLSSAEDVRQPEGRISGGARDERVCLAVSSPTASKALETAEETSSACLLQSVLNASSVAATIMTGPPSLRAHADDPIDTPQVPAASDRRRCSSSH